MARVVAPIGEREREEGRGDNGHVKESEENHQT
jgi:hypothetical protein